MSERKDEKWLDKQLQRAVDGTTPVFDAQAWKQKHREEYQTLLARVASRMQLARTCRESVGQRQADSELPMVLGSLVGRLAVAAAVAVAVGLFVLSRNGHGPGRPSRLAGPVALSSPARMMSMMSLRTTYQQGGFEALDRQLQDTLDEFRPRSSSVPIRGLFNM